MPIVYSSILLTLFVSLKYIFLKQWTFFNTRMKKRAKKRVNSSKVDM